MDMKYTTTISKGGKLMNNDIKRKAKSKGVKLWEVAQKLGISDSNFSRKLRYELSIEEKNEILSIIDELAKKETK